MAGMCVGRGKVAQCVLSICLFKHLSFGCSESNWVALRHCVVGCAGLRGVHSEAFHAKSHSRWSKHSTSVKLSSFRGSCSVRHCNCFFVLFLTTHLHMQAHFLYVFGIGFDVRFFTSGGQTLLLVFLIRLTSEERIYWFRNRFKNLAAGEFVAPICVDTSKIVRWPSLAFLNELRSQLDFRHSSPSNEMRTQRRGREAPRLCSFTGLQGERSFNLNFIHNVITNFVFLSRVYYYNEDFLYFCQWKLSALPIRR